MDRADLRALAQPGARIAVRVTPRGGRDALTVDQDGRILIRVAAAPTDGKANESVRRVLAGALGVAPSRLMLLRGAGARDKLFGLD